jgi:predicted GNAT superfamily acetyltransferase
VSAGQITIRPLETRAEYEACVALQRDIWGPDFVDVVPATILMVSQQVGGVASGAFDAAGRLVGFVFGISGVRDGVTAHWSDMLAVRRDARGLGLARRLKLHQRELLLAVGIERVRWTFDPLVARNARLNLTTLGACPIEYVANMYGETDSLLHRGLDTDRFIVEWRLQDPVVEQALAGTPPRLPPAARAGPIATIATHGSPGDGPPLPDAPWVRVELPVDIEQLKADAPELARRWQLGLRRAFTTYLNARHARVAGICADRGTGRWFYAVDTTGGGS